MIRSRPAAAALLFFLLVPAALYSDEAQLAPFRKMLRTAGFPENDESRRELADVLNAPSPAAVEAPFRIIRQLSDRRPVQFELRRGVREWYLMFRSRRGTEPFETYPVWGRGSWVVKKDLLTGRFIQAKVFLQDDEDTFVRIFPAQGGRSRLDLYLYGRQIGDDVVVPTAFEELILAPFARIAQLTDRSWDWSRIFPDPEQPGYRRVESMVKRVRLYRKRIVEIADAAVDGGGRSVFIETGEPIPPGVVPPGLTGLNCSGFVKWVADGIYSSWRGRPGSDLLEIAPLRKPTGRNSTNPWSESRSAGGADARAELESLLRDPRFGLDWNRNIAYAVESARIRRTLSDDEKLALDAPRVSGIPHRPELGYAFGDLASALYQLAAGRPGAVYLAAVNSRFVPEPSDKDPDPLPLHQYWHVSILAPWFDDGGSGERGAFRVAVLDTGDVGESLLRVPGTDVQPRFPAFITGRAARYARLGRDKDGKVIMPEVMVQLVRMDVPADFEPAPLPEENRLSNIKDVGGSESPRRQSKNSF